MKRLFCLILAAALLLTLTACGAVEKEDLFEKTFRYEKEGAGGAFTVALHSDGRVSYYEGFFSSHLGMGTWTLEGDVLTIVEAKETGFASCNHFHVTKNALIFREEGSTNFLYVKVSDGEKFYLVEE